jgi:hypothetical protein
MNHQDSKAFLNQYVTERLPAFAPRMFEDGPDVPSFASDMRGTTTSVIDANGAIGRHPYVGSSGMAAQPQRYTV